MYRGYGPEKSGGRTHERALHGVIKTSTDTFTH